jgi:hypothetical protein
MAPARKSTWKQTSSVQNWRPGSAYRTVHSGWLRKNSSVIACTTVCFTEISFRASCIRWATDSSIICITFGSGLHRDGRRRFHAVSASALGAVKCSVGAGNKLLRRFGDPPGSDSQAHRNLPGTCGYSDFLDFLANTLGDADGIFSRRSWQQHKELFATISRARS